MDRLLNGEKPRIMARYPHLAPEDRTIWTRFIENGSYLPNLVWYDVRVGMAVEVPSGQPEWMKRFAEYATRKRIDIVGLRGQDYYIIEAKPFAGVVALGQAIYYSEAFRAEYEHQGLVIPAVITDRVDPDVRPVFEAAGVVVFEVGRDESQEETSHKKDSI